MGIINLKNVTKTFQTKDKAVTAVDDVTLSIEKGEIFGVIGFSGAGKSTLVRTLNQLETITNGSVEINGQTVNDLQGKDLRDFRKKVGMIFQHFNLLWSRTVIENIALPLELNGMSKEERTKKATELLKLVGLEGRENAYPSELSGGQKQRVGIARALANDPEILLCDEATSALDPQTTEEVLDLLLSINQKLNLTIVLITHEMNVIRKICHRVAVMENGRVVEEGPVISVFKHPQTEITKRFVNQDVVIETEENQETVRDLIAAYPDGMLLRLLFEGKKATETIISSALREFDININILQANIRPTNQLSFGTMLVQVTGNPELVSESVAYFEKNGVGVEVINYG
ncbi:methionine ABC transporter ATP-binding protein [Vagococcus silagei]|uniref:ATP-binding cassette domain-containing protein n=1 Tax=Vagococcus silagei TaxID=2508885 RepID=A0A4S3B8J9_9ENTE|nr:ATP-binding cassette domain-containing protein [Vagococcus silagei]THB61245.1 ATP-binding cassette domain-containing protein [Vagococcus silagei]